MRDKPLPGVRHRRLYPGNPFDALIVGKVLLEKRRTTRAPTADEMKEWRWLKPELVAQIEFTKSTPDTHLRYASFAALRKDKEAREIVRE
jgi:ATP-dependent DNA ligase